MIKMEIEKFEIQKKFLLLGFIVFSANVLEVKAYQAAVVAYKPLSKKEWTADNIVKSNVQSYVNKIEHAKGKAEIIVFPEYGLTTVAVIGKAKDHLIDYSMVLGDENTNPCANKDKKEVDSNLVLLSCAAKSAGIYVVFNIVEKHNSSYYLTSVVLESSGSIALKCRRKNLPENSTFTADFTQAPCVFSANFKSSKSKLLVASDATLLNAVPSEVDTVIVTSAVLNSLPFYSAPSFHAGFAVRNRVNLLVAGYFDLERGYGGSGIYNIDGDKLVAKTVLGPAGASGTDVLYKELSVVVKKDVSIRVNVEFTPLRNNISYINVSTVTSDNKDYEQCINEICCEFKANFNGQNIDPYRWVANQKKIILFDKEVDVVHCAIVKPKQASLMNIQNLTITSKYRKLSVVQVIPIAVQKNLSIPFYDYHETESYSTMSLAKEEELISFGIIHVLNNVNSANKLSALMPSCFLVSLFVVLFWI